MTNLNDGPVRVLILDSSAEDPRWMIATITLESDVRPAVMDLANGRYTDWPEVTDWARTQVAGSGRISLTPISAMVWRVDEGDPQ